MSDTDRYIVTGPYWGHIFDEEQGEVLTEWVYDIVEEKLVGAMIADRGSLNLPKWHQAKQDELLDLEDSIKNANPDCIDNPEDWGLVRTNELPEFAQPSDSTPGMQL